jgi:streptogramin lyase
MRKVLLLAAIIAASATGVTTAATAGGSNYDREGNVWFCQLNGDRLGRLDAKTCTVSELETGGAYAINVDAGGAIWINELNADTVVRIDPKDGRPRVFHVPSKGSAIRKMTIDAQGRLWYIGASSGKIGLIQ